MEDDRVSYKELLVARSNKRYRKICGKIQHVLENKELNKALVGKLKLSEIQEKP